MNNVFLHLHPTRIHRTVDHAHLLPRRAELLHVPGAHRHRRAADVLLRAVGRRARTRTSQRSRRGRVRPLIRNMHRWMAHAMVMTVFLHMMRVFYTGAYKPPREFNWVVGVILLVLHAVLSLHRLPAAVGPARALGHHRRHGTSAARRPTSATRRSSSSSAASRSARTRSFASTPCTSSRCRCSPRSSWPSTSGASAATAAWRGRV